MGVKQPSLRRPVALRRVGAGVVCIVLTLCGASVAQASDDLPSGDLPSRDLPSRDEPARVSPGVRAVGPDATSEVDRQVQQAAKLVEQAMQRYARRQLDGALDLLEQAYAIRPSASLLFNLASVRAALGRCGEAKRDYQQYLTERPHGARSDRARELLGELGECTQRLADVTTAAALPPVKPPGTATREERRDKPAFVPQPTALQGRPTSIVGAATPAPAVTGDSPSQPWSRAAGLTSLGVSLALATASGVYAWKGLRAERDVEAANAESPVDDLLAIERRGQRHNALAWALGGGAAAFAGIGVALLVVDGSPQASAAVRLGPGSGRLELTLTPRFW